MSKGALNITRWYDDLDYLQCVIPVDFFDLKMMEVALAEARNAFDRGEVPIGAVIAFEGKAIASAFNSVERDQDASSHAELLAIQTASKNLGRWRLEGCSLYVTLEPCAMCLGAIRLARISRLIVGAGESRFGALTKYGPLVEDTELGPVPQVVQGVRKEECQELLQSFFRKVRGG